MHFDIYTKLVSPLPLLNAKITSDYNFVFSNVCPIYDLFSMILYFIILFVPWVIFLGYVI